MYRYRWLQRMLFVPAVQGGKVVDTLQRRTRKYNPDGTQRKSWIKRLVAWNKVPASPAPLTPQMRAIVRETLRPDVEHLSKLLDRDLPTGSRAEGGMLLAAIAGLVLLLGVSAWIAKRRLDAMPTKVKKQILKRKLNSIFVALEERGWIARSPAFDRDYHRHYPSLAKLEAGYPGGPRGVPRAARAQGAAHRYLGAGRGLHQGRHPHDRLEDLRLQSGDFIEENCARCPRTANLLREIPGLYTAFFSVLDPQQVIPPHWGYYKGILRYHLGVVIPNNNADESCWLRVHADPYDNALQRDKKNKQRDTSSIVKGEIYHWHDGEGIVFDDNYLHDAGNGSDQVRVVLWLDLNRPLPLPLDLLNRAVGWVVNRDESVQKIRRNVVVRD